MANLTKKAMKNNDITSLTAEEQKEILAIKDGIELNYAGIQKYGSELDKKYSSFSSSVLQTIRMKDNPEIESILGNLLSQLETIDTSRLMPVKDNFFTRLFRVKDIAAVTAKYQSVQDIVNDARKQLETTSFELKKDVELCEMHLNSSINYVGELDKVIMGGKLRLAEEKRRLEEDLMNTDPDDTYAMTCINQRQYEINRLERKLFLEMEKREAAIHTCREIMVMRENYASLIEQIDTSISNAIPLWETHMFIAIQLIRQQNGMKIQNAVRETTNRLFEANMKMLKENSIGIAKSLENGFLDYDVLKKVHQELIDTIAEIRKIHEDGVKQREQIMAEIEESNKKMNEVQLLGTTM